MPSGTDGISFLPTLLGQTQKQHDYLYWEFPEYKGQQAVRMGPWKGIRKNLQEGNTDIELYNLVTDIQEEVNVASGHPEVVEQIRAILAAAHEPAALDRFRMEALGDARREIKD